MTGADQIWLGALLGETHDKATDKNQMFAQLTSETLQYVLSPFRKPSDIGPDVVFPLAKHGLNKKTSVTWALQNGFTPEDLMATSSCLSGEHGNCGQCVVCLRRWGIFKQHGFEEQYNVHPLTVEDNFKIIREMLKHNSYYDEHRRSEVLPALTREQTLAILNKQQPPLE
jgi:7-cyano-7-deazaguanine synthase in queuosine biosynthesis